MNIKKKDALYKIKGTKFPKKLYEVWTDTEGECLVDIWILEDKKENLYSLDETIHLEHFNESYKLNLEEMRTKYKIVDNCYLKLLIPKREKDLEILKKLVPLYKEEVMEILNRNQGE